jgi:carboxyl-terminal processing protease
MKIRILYFFIVMLVVPIYSQKNNDELGEYFELYNKIFETFTSNYVDTLDKTKLIKASFDGMFKEVDPYTKLYIGSSKDRLEILTKGKYGGIGMQIGLIQDTLTVLMPYEDSPSYSEGIQSGDQILMVDSISTIGLSSSESSALIRGELDTELVLTVLRPSINKEIEFNLIRSNIIVKDVPFWQVNEDGVSYVRIKKFSKNTAKDFKMALNQILKDKKTKGLIIDLRGNTGGLLSNALNILDQLVPKGQNLLKTKGRIAKANRNFNSKYSSKIPEEFPMVVLIDGRSASASEIVSGTLQDLDLALVLGSTSFGKGLVQRIYTINDSISLKVTTSKYYTPSGRLIQKKDYLDNDVLTDGLEDSDSTFYTKNGRIVKGGGGIHPDVEIEKRKIPPLVQSLYRERLFIKFASEYVFKEEIALPIKINKKIIKDFINYVQNYEINHIVPGELELLELKNNIYDKYAKENFSKKNKYNFQADDSYMIVDAYGWLRIKNGSGKTVKLVPPEKHDLNTGEYYYTETRKIISKSSLKNTDLDYLSTLTKNLEDYFSQVKVLQYIDKENIRWIDNALLREMSLVLGNEKEKIKVSLYNDVEYLKAAELILDQVEYNNFILP